MRVFKHPDQMTPGSLWKVKGMKGLRLLEGDYKVGCNYRGWSRRSKWNPQTKWFMTEPMPVLDFDIGILYLLVGFRCSEHGLIEATFVAPERIVRVTMYETFWDRSFRLAKKTSDPKPLDRLLFDKYDVDELKARLGME